MPLQKRTNYLEDDWGDNALTGRTGSTEGYFLHPSDGLISDVEAGDALKAVYRPDWNVERGSVSATSGELVFPGDGTDDAVITPTDFLVGRWKVDRRWVGSESDAMVFQMFAETTTFHARHYHDGYYLRISEGTDSQSFYRCDDGADTELIAYTGDGGTATYTEEVTRDSYGNWEWLTDGTSHGTFTDRNYEDPKILAFACDGTSDAAFDNLVVK